MDLSVFPELMAVTTFMSSKIRLFRSQLDLAVSGGEVLRACINLSQTAK